MPNIVEGTHQIYLHGNKHKNIKVKIRRFCVDIDEEREAYEKLVTQAANGEVRLVKEPTEVYSQRGDKFYMVVQWQER